MIAKWKRCKINILQMCTATTTTSSNSCRIIWPSVTTSHLPGWRWHKTVSTIRLFYTTPPLTPFRNKKMLFGKSIAQSINDMPSRSGGIGCWLAGRYDDDDDGKWSNTTNNYQVVGAAENDVQCAFAGIFSVS